MEELLTDLLSSLVTGICRVIVEGDISSYANDSLAQRLLRVFILLLAADVSMLELCKMWSTTWNEL